MVTTRWKKQIERSGRSQRSLAKALSVNVVEMSMVCQGRAFLTPEKFKLACELLDCCASDIYQPDVISLIYGMAPSEQTRKRGLRVELEPKQQEFVEWMAEREGKSKSRIVNEVIDEAILRRKMGL